MRLVFASNNKNKILEIQSMLSSHLSIVSLEDIGCFEEIPETADTIEGNAILKANYITEKYGFDCFADDTGLEINALNGRPGVYSAHYAGEQRSAADNMDKVLSELAARSDRTAQFKTVIVINMMGQQHLFTGTVAGAIALKKVGSRGFGYDPIFIAHGFKNTFAELSLDQKSAISHRGIAVKQLIAFLNESRK